MTIFNIVVIVVVAIIFIITVIIIISMTNVLQSRLDMDVHEGIDVCVDRYISE